ncbi:MAG: hypothetical protein QOC82_728 [Frankiaceae bacterium]|nr:hypothetical protein [Frankiaceae bacterium]
MSYVDPRGPRVSAAITSAVLVAVLVTGSGWLLAVQAGVFAVGAIAGLHASPYGLLYRRLVAPRLAPPDMVEPEGPPRFAQGVGLAFALAGTAGYLGGIAILGVVATALALFAALLNAVFGLCLGCEAQLRLARLLGRPVVCQVPRAMAQQQPEKQKEKAYA